MEMNLFVPICEQNIFAQKIDYKCRSILPAEPDRCRGRDWLEPFHPNWKLSVQLYFSVVFSGYCLVRINFVGIELRCFAAYKENKLYKLCGANFRVPQHPGEVVSPALVSHWCLLTSCRSLGKEFTIVFPVAGARTEDVGVRYPRRVHDFPVHPARAGRPWEPSLHHGVQRGRTHLHRQRHSRQVSMCGFSCPEGRLQLGICCMYRWVPLNSKTLYQVFFFRFNWVLDNL